MFQDARRVAQVALRQADGCQCDRASDHVGEMSGALQAGHAGCIVPVGGSEVANRPRREPQQRCRSTMSQIVVRLDVVERQAGKLRGCPTIPTYLSESGAVDGDRAGQLVKLLFVHDHHVDSGAVQPAFGVP